MADDIFGAMMDQAPTEEPTQDAGDQQPVAQEFEGEPQQTLEPELDYRTEYLKLQQKVGTETDVNTVKSQRDQAVNAYQQLQAQLQQAQQQMQQLQQWATQVQQENQSYQQWALSQLPPEQQQAYVQQAQAYQQQQTWQQVQEENQRLRAAMTQQQSQQVGQQVMNGIVNAYTQAAQAVGVDPQSLDWSNYPALQASFNKLVKPLQQVRQNPPPNPPQVPARGAPNPRAGVWDWFQNKVQKGQYQDVDDLITRAMQGGLTNWEDIVSR